MRKTKIICTMGPATMDQEVLKKLCLGGMNVARMNFSHGSHDSHLEQLNLLQEIREQLGLPIGTMCDTKGPEIRTGLFHGGKAVLKAGETFTFENLHVTVGQVKDKRILTLMVRVTPDPKHPAKSRKPEEPAEKKAE